MCDGKVSKKKMDEIWIQGSSKRTVLTGDWMLAFGADTLRVMVERRAADGTCDLEVYFRYASTRTDQPGAWSPFTGAFTQSTNGRSIDDEDISGTTDKLWVQAAVRASSGASATGEALAGIQVSTKAEGRIIAARTIQIQPVANTGEAVVIPLANPHPSLGLNDYMFVVILEGVDGTVSYEPAVRTFATGLDDAGGWTGLLSGTPTSSADYNSDALSITTGTTLFAQPGLKITSTGGRATARVIVAMK